MKTKKIFSSKIFILFFAFIICICFSEINGQVLTKFYTAKESINKKDIHPVDESKIFQKTLPSFDFKKVLEEDSIEINSNVPFRFGKDFNVDIDVLKQGTLVQNADTTLIYIKISSKGAYSLNMIFDNFHLNETTSIKIYNTEHSFLYGPITFRNNPKNGVFWTDLIKGESLIIEVLSIKGNIKNNLLHISKVIHGYRNVFSGYGQSAWCNKDVVCSEVSGWQNESDAVAMLLLSDGTRFGSGALVNNTSQDLTPYFLTAFHCLDMITINGTIDSEERNAVNNWLFRFQYQRSTCGYYDCYSYYTIN